MEWALGTTHNYPERHCCACGKPQEPGHQIDLGVHWQDYGHINHELAHFLGFKHEQQRLPQLHHPPQRRNAGKNTKRLQKERLQHVLDGV